MFKDFKEIAKKSNALENLVWLCTIKESEKFTVDLVTDKKDLMMLHVGKNGYKHDGFYMINIVGLSDLHDEELEDIANVMVSDIIKPEGALLAENIEDIKNILNAMNN